MAKSERREGKRRNRSFGFHFAAIGADGSSAGLVEGTLIDYSLAGIRFVTDTELRKNTHLFIELLFENFGSESKDWRALWEEREAGSLKLIGSVMWCQEKKNKSGEFEVGTRFVEKAPQI